MVYRPGQIPTPVTPSFPTLSGELGSVSTTTPSASNSIPALNTNSSSASPPPPPPTTALFLRLDEGISTSKIGSGVRELMGLWLLLLLL